MCMGMIKYERWKYIIRFVDVVLDTPVYNAYDSGGPVVGWWDGW